MRGESEWCVVCGVWLSSLDSSLLDSNHDY
jgi:hypothetical protein